MRSVSGDDARRVCTEWLWFNFPAPVALHDYGFLNFRERERIKRKKQRWTERLQRLLVLERQALLAAIEDAWPDQSSIVKHDDATGRHRCF